jgi:hypothetical protein
MASLFSVLQDSGIPVSLFQYDDYNLIASLFSLFLYDDYSLMASLCLCFSTMTTADGIPVSLSQYNDCSLMASLFSLFLVQRQQLDGTPVFPVSLQRLQLDCIHVSVQRLQLDGIPVSPVSV